MIKLDDICVELQAPFGYNHTSHSFCFLNEQLRLSLRESVADHVSRCGEQHAAGASSKVDPDAACDLA